MLKEVCWQIGGEQGSGLDSTAEVFNTVASRAGYYVYAYKTFASRIKGGHTDFTTRISVERVLAPAAGVNLLVVLDQESINLCARNVYPGAIVLADEAFDPQLPEGLDAKLLTMPFNKMALALGNTLMKNNIVLGASAAFLGLPLEHFKKYAVRRWGNKGEDFVALIHTAMEQGYNHVVENWPDLRLELAQPDGQERLLMTGNDAAALGALAGGCRLMFSYPITPASEIAENLVKAFPKVGGIAVQMEDELGSIVACVGAGFGGARAMTATSGPGISLMQEAIGLASMTETPVVVVNTQRGGPSTGMPTKQEQSDLLAMAYGGHGDGPRIVLAPGSVEELIPLTAEAFNLADNYHCPVLIASDLALALFQQTVEPDAADLANLPKIDRGPIADPEQLAALGRDIFERYSKQVNENGVSARSLPGMKNGQFLATGAEHGPMGKVTENPANRVYMMNRRLRRITKVNTEAVRYFGSPNADLVLLAFGTTLGAAKEAQPIIEQMTGKKVGVLQIRLIYPVPTAEIARYVGDGKALVVESNATGQFAFMLKGTGYDASKVASLLRYDGNLFTVKDIVDGARAVLAGEAQYLVTGGGQGVRPTDDPTIALAAKEA
ncbi:2-oxoglutarate ferredoxin oxidoreductase subunit alpha [Symbiobacterium terraclitae]|uniref:2-oxoglutarate ferredoxin oxidoreductase subunit alpha n=1 Tax=Symbiobacterium terraclitae TaxID=557451 RepID=A0ABS4JSQ7_9FIRM|nr:2-oxoacid:acceptor oxidoreductase subunit alpha [Symbiobacterium terraclitae]MBP2018550.1 2-oxoglutarate ferredoxin oxidoreductase subunit alpha [Symbiobacterium terraclitae]